MQWDTQKIIQEMIENSKSFIEKPHSVFNNLPVCPFAKKARLQNRLSYLVYPFDVTKEPMDEGRMLAEIAMFRTTSYHMAWFIHPDKGLPVKAYNRFFEALRKAIRPEGLVAFAGHPDHTMAINGLFIRKDPYPNLQVIHKAELEIARTKLKQTNYYELLGEYDLDL